MRQFIYFAQTGDAIKIGITVDLKQRLIDLQCGCPTKIKYVHTMLSTKDITERQFHEKFYEYRLRGEWYKAESVLKCLPIKANISPAINKFTSEQEMDSAWKIKMEHEVERLITEHRNRFK